MPPRHNAGLRPAHLHQGFTLLEVLVAMTLIGLGLAVAFTAISGTAHLDGKMAAHQAAMTLARSKLNEALAHPDFKLAPDAGEDHYAGMDFGYRIALRPMEWLTPAQRERIPAFQQKLERIEIEVFWGPENAKQSYTLSSFRIAPPNASAQPRGPRP